MRDLWPTIRDTLSIDDRHKHAVAEHMESVPLFRA
jgi:hypothetical protein